MATVSNQRQQFIHTEWATDASTGQAGGQGTRVQSLLPPLMDRVQSNEHGNFVGISSIGKWLRPDVIMQLKVTVSCCPQPTPSHETYTKVGQRKVGREGRMGMSNLFLNFYLYQNLVNAAPLLAVCFQWAREKEQEADAAEIKDKIRVLPSRWGRGSRSRTLCNRRSTDWLGIWQMGPRTNSDVLSAFKLC